MSAFSRDVGQPPIISDACRGIALRTGRLKEGVAHKLATQSNRVTQQLFSRFYEIAHI